MTHTYERTRDPGYDLHVPWERWEGDSVYNGGAEECVDEVDERVDRGKEICSLGAADGHVMTTWLMGVIVRVELHVT